MTLRAAAVVALVLAMAPPAVAQEPQTTLPDVEDEVMCPVCGTTLELASDSQQAIREREFIRGLIAEGRSKEEIKAALVAEFGDEVLALPDDEGFDLAAWLVPGVAIVAAAIAIFVALRRWRRASDHDGPGRHPSRSTPRTPGGSKPTSSAMGASARSASGRRRQRGTHPGCRPRRSAGVPAASAIAEPRQVGLDRPGQGRWSLSPRFVQEERGQDVLVLQPT